MTGDFGIVRSGAAAAIVRHDFRPAFEAHRLIECPRAPTLSVPAEDGRRELPGGRGAVRIVDAGPLGEAVLRPYRRGGLVGRFNRRRYFAGNRAFDELVCTHRLRRRGAPVPEALAAVQVSLRPGYAGCLATRRVPRSRPSSIALAAPGAPVEALLEAMGRSVRRFHEAGGVHADLNAHNLLVSDDADGPVTIIDLDRGSVCGGPAPPRIVRANRQRLRRSLRKLELFEALERWDAFLRGYETPPEPPPAA